MIRTVIILFFFNSIIYSQEIDVLESVYQQTTELKRGSYKPPKNIATDLVKECNQRIEENPNDWQAYYQRAKSHQILYDFKLSIEDTDVLIANGELLNFAFWIQGESYIYLKDFVKAIEAYKKAINYYQQPYTKARINFIIGMCYIQIEKEDQACLYFEKMGDYRTHNAFKQANQYCQ